MVDVALLHETSELIARNFKADDIQELGKLLFKDFDCHKLAGKSSHITLSSKKCAVTLVEYSSSKNKTFELMQLLVALDGSTLNGKPVSIEGIEAYLNKLTNTGIYYDFRKQKVLYSKKEVSGLVNWGSLKEGKEYTLTILSMDIVGNSKLVKKYSSKIMEKIYFNLKSFLTNKLYEYNGRLWNFAGDGGLAAFTFKDQITRSVLCALDIQTSIPIFNLNPDFSIDDPVELRIGIDSGKIKFTSDTGHIVSEVINFAAHLEKYATSPGHVSISDTVAKQLNKKILRLFREKKEFEDRTVYSTVQSIF